MRLFYFKIWSFNSMVSALLPSTGWENSLIFPWDNIRWYRHSALVHQSSSLNSSILFLIQLLKYCLLLNLLSQNFCILSLNNLQLLFKSLLAFYYLKSISSSSNLKISRFIHQMIMFFEDSLTNINGIAQVFVEVSK
jgi:hypothetical protein